MNGIVGLNKKIYINTVAENYLCVPAVLETVIKSEGIKEIGKYDLANFFGVVLPNGLEYPQITNFSHSGSAQSLGVNLKYNSINALFEFYNIPLVEEYVKINFIDRDFFADYLYDVLIAGKHVVCGFEYHSLYKLTGEYSGHVSIVFDADKTSDTVHLIDPGPRDAGIKTVKTYDLYQAISKAKDGLWIISQK